MQKVGLASGSQQIVLVDLRHVGQSSLLPAIPDQVFIEMTEKTLYVMRNAAAKPPTHLIPHLVWKAYTMTPCQCR
jgi:hypothetical protein